MHSSEAGSGTCSRPSYPLRSQLRPGSAHTRGLTLSSFGMCLVSLHVRGPICAPLGLPEGRNWSFILHHPEDVPGPTVVTMATSQHQGALPRKQVAWKQDRGWAGSDQRDPCLLFLRRRTKGGRSQGRDTADSASGEAQQTSPGPGLSFPAM